MSYKSKSGKKQIFAGLITLAVIALLIFAGPASAIDLSMNEFSNSSPVSGEVVSTIASITINSNERMSMPNPAGVFIDDVSVCDFAVNSGADCSDAGVTVSLISSSDSRGYGYGYDLGYGYGYNYGYANGYGYGYGYQQGYSNSRFTYNITVDTAHFASGEHTIKLVVDAGDSKVYSSGKQTITIREGREDIAAIFDRISANLRDQGIENNLDEVDASNVEAFSGMYTEKALKGRITFTNALNLSDNNVRTFLENFGEKMDMSNGHIALDARTAEGLRTAGAVLEMYNLPQGLTLDQISLSVTDEDGNPVSEDITSAMNYTDLGVCEVGGKCTIFSFSAAHFTTFDAVIDDSHQKATGTMVEVGENTTEIVFDSDSENVTSIVVPSTIDSDKNITLDLGALLVGTDVTLNNELTLERRSSDGVNYTVVIPAGTVITGPAGWDGKILLPTVRSNGDYSVSGTLSVVVDLGSTEELTFSEAVKVILGGMAGKAAAWSRGTGGMTSIDTVCNSTHSNINTVDPRECYIDSGDDLSIWTYHFTSFGAYTPSVTSSGGSGGGTHVPANYVLLPAAPRVPQNESAPAADITNDNVAGSDSSTQAGRAGITGAAIGALGPTGWTLVIVFLVVIVIAYVYVLRKRKKGKKSKKDDE